MERVFSVDDIVGGIWKLGPGFNRTDSETAFQDFLKRIPSTTNLVQAGDLNQQQQLQLQQHVVQQFQAQQHSLQNGSSGASHSTALGEPGSLNVGGIPRVPSLDLLRQLVSNSQGNQTLSPLKNATSAPESAPPQTCSAVPTTDMIPAMAALPVLAGLAPSTTGVQSSAALSHPAVAAALQYNQLQGLQQLQTPEQEGQLESKLDAKAELRRARRMLSNRESARRSRRRKQEHLSTIEEQMAKLVDEKKVLEEELEDSQELVKQREDECKKLKQEVEMLRRELEGYRDGKPEGTRDHGKKVARTTSLQKMGSGEHPHKKACNGHETRAEKAEVKHESGLASKASR